MMLFMLDYTMQKREKERGVTVKSDEEKMKRDTIYVTEKEK